MSPLWSKNSKEIFFWSGGNQYSVSYSTGKLDSNEKPQFIDLAAPQKIFSIQGLQNGLTLPAWDYDGNSDKFLMLETQTNSTFTGINEEGVSSNTELYVVENWFAELNIRAPVIKWKWIPDSEIHPFESNKVNLRHSSYDKHVGFWLAVYTCARNLNA